jgi:hypothetical protein
VVVGAEVVLACRAEEAEVREEGEYRGTVMLMRS